MKRSLPGTLLRYLLWLTFAAMPLSSHAIEEPDYEVIRKFDQVELHQNAHFVVTEVELNANADEVGSQAFPIMARYNGPMTTWFMRHNEIWLVLR